MRFTIATTLGIAMMALSGCAQVAPPVNAPIQAAPFKIIVPKDILNVDGSYQGVQLSPVDKHGSNIYRTLSTSGKQYYTVRYTPYRAPANGMVTDVCEGELGTLDTQKFESCAHVGSYIKITDLQTAFEVEFTPFRFRAEQQRDEGIGAIPIPFADVSGWYPVIAHHAITFEHKATANFSPEATKANFDRALPRFSWHEGQSDAALKQFKDAYYLDAGNGVTAYIGIKVYPYHKGSLVEFHIDSTAQSQAGVMTRDWRSIVSAIRARLDQITHS